VSRVIAVSERIDEVEEDEVGEVVVVNEQREKD